MHFFKFFMLCCCVMLYVIEGYCFRVLPSSCRMQYWRRSWACCSLGTTLVSSTLLARSDIQPILSLYTYYVKQNLCLVQNWQIGISFTLTKQYECLFRRPSPLPCVFGCLSYVIKHKTLQQWAFIGDYIPAYKHIIIALKENLTSFH